jgi:4-hydroxy-tetrahydrodipicolinate synthase
MKANPLKGACVALVTPFAADGSLDETALRGLVDWQIEQGIDSLAAAGTTGEAATLSREEQLRLIEVVIDQAGGRCPVVAGTGSNSTARSVEMTLEAEKLGCAAVLVVGPYYNKPTQEGLYRHFRAVAESTRLPVIVYNVPGRTASNIAPETVLRLAALDNVTAVKEASGDLPQIMRILRERPEGFLVLSGDDALTLPILALGGDGVISVVANECPAEFRRMVWACLEGRWQEAREIHYRLLPLMEANFIESNPIPVKAALAMMGRIREEYRLPLVPMSDANRSRMRALLEALDLPVREAE